MNNKPNKLRITISNYGVESSCEMSQDSSIDDIMCVIKGLLVSLTYSEFSFDEWAIEYADEINQERNDRATDTGQED